MFNILRSKKAQGLPLNFIVLAAIAVLILVLIVAFVVGGGGGLLGQLFQTGPTPKETIVKNCDIACNELQTITSTTQFTVSKYCTKTYAVDVDGSGKIEAAKGETGLKCWGKDIGAGCSVTFRTTAGDTKTCSMDSTVADCTTACG